MGRMWHILLIYGHFLKVQHTEGGQQVQNVRREGYILPESFPVAFCSVGMHRHKQHFSTELGVEILRSWICNGINNISLPHATFHRCRTKMPD